MLHLPEFLNIGIGLAVGAALGAAFAWLLARSRHARANALLGERSQQLDAALDEQRALRHLLDELRTELGTVEKRNVQLSGEIQREREAGHEKIALLQEAELRLRDTFRALSSESLKSNNESFLELAKKTLETTLKEARGDLGAKREEIAGIVKPLREALAVHEAHIREIEGKRQKDQGTLEARILGITASQELLQRETGRLVNALRRPEVRGQWGEMTLRNIVELAGMTEHCDFDVQVHVETEERAYRPDMVVQLPAGKSIVVDAKTPLDAYLAAVEADTDEERSNALDGHVRQVRQHIEKLSSKSYWRVFENAPEFVVMFMPESFFVAAVQRDRNLLEHGMQKRVVLATPTTLIALLWAVAYGWRQEELARNARRISALGEEIHDRLVRFTSHFENMRRGLDRAVDSYNSAVGSLESRVLTAARRFKDLGVSGRSEVPPTTRIEKATRQLSITELFENPDESPKTPPRR